jgi:hypothetical protein
MGFHAADVWRIKLSNLQNAELTGQTPSMIAWVPSFEKDD